MPSEADWIFYGPSQFDRALINNPFMYDLSNQIGRYAVRTRWVEMYLNRSGEVTSGDYVGVYAIMEVIEEDEDRVDVGKLSTGAGGIPVEGGFIWKIDRGSPYVDPQSPTSAQRSYIDREIQNLRSAASSANYRDPELGYARYADVDSFIDAHILNVLAQNVDSLRLSAYYFKTPDGKIEMGPIWDFDRSLDSTDGRDNNPTVWSQGGGTDHFRDSSGSWWPRMFQDPDFVQRYIDRWHELRNAELSNESLFASIDKQADQIAEAAPRDYARWSSSRFGNFAGEINHMKSWLRTRANWIDSRFLDSPASNVETPAVEAGTQVSLSGPSGAQIYYTLDGTDPRGFGGVIRPEAIRYVAPITVNDFTQVTARAYRSGFGGSTPYSRTGDDWSPPLAADFFINAPASQETVAITEVHYHPADPTPAELAAGFDDDDDFEFIEITNIASFPVQLTGAQLMQVDIDVEEVGVDFEFSEGEIAILQPGERVVVVEDIDAFEARYGNDIPVAGQWSGGLSNNRETITLSAFDGEIITQFEYRDEAGWPLRADGTGSSIVIIDTSEDYNNPDNWRASAEVNGSPGTPELASPGVVINEVLSHTDLPQVDSIELYNTTNQPIDISGWYLSDSDEDYLKYRIPNGTIIGASQYLVYDETDFNSGAPGVTNFALNGAEGDDVWLVRADDEGTITTFVDEAHFAAAPNGESFGRFPNASGPLVPMLQTTLGEPNSGVRVGPVLLSEIQYAPDEPVQAALAIFPELEAADLEFVEISNTSNAPVDLTNWRIRGGIDFDFPAGALEPGGTRVVVSFDPTDQALTNKYVSFLIHYGIDPSVGMLGPFDGRLNNAGERVTLQRPDDPPIEDPTIIPRLIEDEVIYDDIAPWPVEADGTGVSLQRLGTDSFGSDAANWEARNPNPGTFDFEPSVRGDFNGDDIVNVSDIDALYSAVNRQVNPSGFDLTGDNDVNQSDVDELVQGILGTNYGDVDLDGDVDVADSTAMAVGWTGALQPLGAAQSWLDGDIDGDGDVDTADRNLLIVNWTGAIDAAMASSLQSEVPVRRPVRSFYLP